MDIRLSLMAGTDIPVPVCKMTIHQPRIKEIALIGETDFFTGLQCLCLNKTMFIKDESRLEDFNNFHIFMTIMSEKEAAEKKFAVQQVCTLLFPQYRVIFTPRTLIFMKDEEQIIIDETNFEELQAIISEVCCLKSNLTDQSSFNPADSKAREIAEKLMRGRQRVAAQKGQNNVSVFTQYLSILTVGLHGMSLQSLMDLTIFQLYDLVERYMLYVNWDIDIRCRLAGGKPDGQADNWMKNIH